MRYEFKHDPSLQQQIKENIQKFKEEDSMEKIEGTPIMESKQSIKKDKSESDSDKSASGSEEADRSASGEGLEHTAPQKDVTEYRKILQMEETLTNYEMMYEQQIYEEFPGFPLSLSFYR